MQEQNFQEDEISIKDLILKAREIFSFLLSQWWKIILIAALGAGTGIYYSTTQKPVYTASLTFGMQEKESGGGGSIAAFASQFGFDMGSGGNNSVFAGENLLQLMKSKLLVEKVLLTPVTINGKEELLANRYIESHEYRKGWKKSKKPEIQQLAKFQYDANQPRENYTLLQDSLLGAIAAGIIKTELTAVRTDKKLSIVTVAVKSEDEIFAKYFAKTVTTEVTDFYIETKTRHSIKNIEILERRVDSVQNELKRAMYGVASNTDRNQFLITSVARVSGVEKQLQVTLLSTLYGELVKNLEISKATLAREQPLMQIIDEPRFPLEKKRFGKLKGLLIGGFAAGFSTISFLLFRRWWKRMMAS